MQYLLFFVACLSGQPGECLGERIALPEVTNATACHLASRLRLREWMVDHPDMRVRDAKCMGRNLAAARSGTGS